MFRLGLLLALVLVAPRTEPVHKRVILVMDCSGSMDGRVSAALSAFSTVARQPVDDMELAVYAFGTTWDRYPKRGFIDLPDAEGVDKAQAWLGNSGVGTNTYAVPALKAALKEPGPRTVVLVSDGQFYNEGKDRVLKAVGKEPVLIFGVGKGYPVFDAMAKNGGGYYRVTND